MFWPDWTKPKSSIYIETARDVWKWLNQTTVRRSDVDETLICLQGISEKLPRTMWANKNEHRPVRFPPRSNRLTFFFQLKWSCSRGHFAIENYTGLPHTTHEHFFFSLSKVIYFVHKRRPTAGTSKSLLLHPNASPHRAKVTESYLQEQDIQVLDRPPYSPDLVSCDFWPFFAIQGAAGRMEVCQGLGPLKSRHSRAQRYTCHRLSKCSSDVVEAARNSCG